MNDFEDRLHNLVIEDTLHEISQHTVDALLATGAIIPGSDEGEDHGQQMNYLLNPEHMFSHAEVTLLLSTQ